MRLFIRALGGETLPLEANSVRRCPTGCRKSVSHEVFAWLLCRSWDGLHDGCQVPSTATVVALQQLLAEKAADVDNHSQRSLLGQPLQLEVHQWIAYCS